MKNKSRLIGALSVALLCASALQPSFAAGETKTWGFVNVKGEYFIKPQYLNAGEFSEGLAPVQIKVQKDDGSSVERWGFVNKQGETAIQATFDEVHGFSEGLAAAKQPDGNWGFIDKTGKFVIEPKFDRADRFADGLAAARDEHDKWGYVDKQGNWAIKPQFQTACRFSGDRAAVLHNDHTGMLSIHVGDDIYTAHGGHWNYIDKSGKVVIDSLFEASGLFADGIAPVAMGANQGVAVPDKWGFVNTKGTLAIKPQFANVHAPSEGLVAVQTGQWKKLGHGYRTWTADKWGYINTKGKQVVKSQFDGADQFSEGMAGVLIDGKWGYIDKTGKVVIEPKFIANGAFHDELAPVCVEQETKTTN